MNGLTERQYQLAILVRCGLTNKEIASIEGTTSGVIRNRLGLIYRKLGIDGEPYNRRTRLAVMVVQDKKSEQVQPAPDKEKR